MSNGKVTITKQFKFDASHFIPGHHHCGKMHGHTYHMEVELEGTINDNGMIMDFSQIKDKIQPYVDVLDHNTLNEVKGLKVPTAENIVLWLVEQIERTYPKNLVRVRVWEGDGSYAEWKKTTPQSINIDDIAERVSKETKEMLVRHISQEIANWGIY